MTTVKQEMRVLEGEDSERMTAVCIEIHKAMHDMPDRRVARLLAMLACNAGGILAPVLNGPDGKRKVDNHLAEFLLVTVEQMEQVAAQMRKELN
jgi:hypothetical protein